MPSPLLYHEEPGTSQKILNPILLLLFFFGLVFLASDSNNYNKIIKQDELIKITGVLSNKPTIETASEGGPWVPILLKEFPNFKFDVAGVKYTALKAKKFVANTAIGDTITLEILKHDHDAKLLDRKKLRFSEKIINYKFIEPYSIEVHGESYMLLKDANEAWSNNHSLGKWLTLWFSGVIVIVGLIYLILHLTGALAAIKQFFKD